MGTDQRWEIKTAWMTFHPNVPRSPCGSRQWNGKTIWSGAKSKYLNKSHPSSCVWAGMVFRCFPVLARWVPFEDCKSSTHYWQWVFASFDWFACSIQPQFLLISASEASDFWKGSDMWQAAAIEVKKWIFPLSRMKLLLGCLAQIEGLP